jgi:hypothetical protein
MKLQGGTVAPACCTFRRTGARCRQGRRESARDPEDGMGDIAFGFQAAPASEVHKSDQALYREVM